MGGHDEIRRPFGKPLDSPPERGDNLDGYKSRYVRKTKTIAAMMNVAEIFRRHDTTPELL